jgi:hypothetical protein
MECVYLLALVQDGASIGCDFLVIISLDVIILPTLA